MNMVSIVEGAGRLGRSACAMVVVLLMSTSIAVAQSRARLQIMTAAPKGEIRSLAPVDRDAATLRGVTTATPANVAAFVALREYANQFGITDPAAELQEMRSFDYGRRGQVVRYRQLRQGLPVIAGDAVVVLTPERQLESITAKLTTQSVTAITPRISAIQAQRVAAVATAKYESVPLVSLVASDPELSIYDPKLFGPRSELPSLLVWKTEISAVSPLNEIHYFVLVNALDGTITLNFNQVETARNRLTYTANNTSGLQTTLLCNESQLLCTSGINTDADLAHRYAGETYDFYFTRFGRDSYNNAGGSLISTVQSTYTGCPNAAWLGTQMVYCAGAPQADDVVGHELTHGVTGSTSKLYYYFQSGAINESLSDVFGEFVDLTNTTGTDTAAVRWKMGEDFPVIGAIRDMRNPPLFSDPDRMTSTLYWTAATDNGGVHTNSGINNKAAYLLVDGDIFNGIKVTGIGLEKVARLYYEVNTRFLTSGSDYADLALALSQACRGLVGSNGFTAADCVQVANAIDAVEMNKAPSAWPDPEAALCPIGQSNTDTYYDSFETLPSPTGWSAAAIAGLNPWLPVTAYATNGVRAYAVNSPPATTSDAVLFMNTNTVVPANAYLHFHHNFTFEANSKGTGFFDGGVVEYSINNGATWNDAGSLISAGISYGGTLATGNPLAGRSAFVGSSHGYGSTKINLAALAGQQLRVRFRNVTDSSIATGPPWIIDEVRIYSCATDIAANVLPVADAGADQTVKPEANVTVDGSLSGDADGALVASQWSQVSGPLIVITNSQNRYLNFTAPVVATQGIAVLRLSVTDNRGATATDDVSISIVNNQPVANAGADQTAKPRSSVTLAGSGTDSDGTIASYNWTQVSGTSVVLVNAQTPNANFVVPSVSATVPLVFRLTTMDNYGGTGIDDVVINAVNDQPIATASADISVSPGASFTLTGSGIDPDGTVTSQTWSQIAGTPMTITNPTSSNLSLTASANTETLIFRFTVTDNDGGTGIDDVAVAVKGATSATKGGGSAGGIDLLILTLFACGMRGRRRYFG